MTQITILGSGFGALTAVREIRKKLRGRHHGGLAPPATSPTCRA
ncbi:MAG: hypothetical protein R3D59_12415 [Paracoccaceae bacterium]